MSREEEEAEYGMVLPFITTVSHGGPHEDVAYVAGWECGEINARLEFDKPDTHTMTVHSANVGQLDLVAMHQGYVMESKPAEGYEDEWTFVTFRRARD